MYAVVIDGKVAERFISKSAAVSYAKKHGGIVRKEYRRE